jgi:UDP-N-acetylglucosamine 4,6-dehydratase/5-epimerase
MLLSDNILITGGTGYLGQAIVQYLSKFGISNISIFSRDEVKQARMKTRYPNVSYILGDVRDSDRVKEALRGIDVVIHAAALKRIDSLESAPSEAFATNISGTSNIIKNAISNNVKKVVFISTDKACMPVTTYGVSKLAAEKLITNANKPDSTLFASVRYGNVLNSTGSLIHIFNNQKNEEQFTITHPDMTRFMMTHLDAIRLISFAICHMKGKGEIFVPKAPSFKITDLAKAIDPDKPHKIIGLRGIEKIHESLISPEEMMFATETPNEYIINPFGAPDTHNTKKYASDTNTEWLTISDLNTIIQ